MAKVKSLYVGPKQDPNWVLNGLKYGAIDDKFDNATAPYVLSTNELRRHGTDDPYCLDAGTGQAGSVVTAPVCYLLGTLITIATQCSTSDCTRMVH